jgi:hypothetical protein
LFENVTKHRLVGAIINAEQVAVEEEVHLEWSAV